MFVIEVPRGSAAQLVGPFASFLEAKEYMIDSLGDSHAGRVLSVEPINPLHLIEPGL